VAIQLCLTFEKLPWKEDKDLLEEVDQLFVKRQYENWVIFRFGCELGDRDGVDLVFRGKYPDAILVKMTGEKLEALNIEFEERSSDFKRHGHDPEKCDLIVCAYDDWKEKYPNDRCPLPVYVVGSLKKEC